MKKSVLAIAAVIAGFANGRVGVGSCPKNYTPLPMPFRTAGTVTDGHYHLMRFDKQFKWGWDTFERQPGETLNCQSGVISKNTDGFLLAQRDPLEAFRWWP